MVGRTYRQTTLSNDDSDGSLFKSDLNAWIFGVNLSTYRMSNPMLFPGIGLGLHLDDGVFAVDLMPKLATMFGTMGFGFGATLDDGKPGFVTEGWYALWVGLRIRSFATGKNSGGSLSVFVPIPLSW